MRWWIARGARLRPASSSWFSLARASIPVLVLAFFPMLAPAARASDGELEINQTCALQTGCFAGDSAGFPVTISAAGSYRLTSHLVIPNDDTDGIRISTSDVAIDLNRFAVIRSGCLDNNSICRPNSGNGSGIETTTTDSRGVSVRNGSIVGLGSAGITLGEQALVRDVIVRWNGDDGIYVDVGSTVADCLVFGNGGDGIRADSGSTVVGNTIYDNTGDGVETGTGAFVKTNTLRNNTGVALRLGSQSAYRENVMTSNGGGCLSGGVSLGDNACNGATN